MSDLDPNCFSLPPMVNNGRIFLFEFLIGHLTISLINFTQINFMNTIFFVRVDGPLFYKNLEESMRSRCLNTNTNLRRNATLREKIHRLACNDLCILIWYSYSTVRNLDKEMYTIEKNNISSWYCSKYSIPRLKLVK